MAVGIKLKILSGQVDPSAKPESHPGTTDKQSWIDISELREEIDNALVRNFSTCEHNYAPLDGSQAYFPDNPAAIPYWGLITKSVSDENGNYNNPPLLTILFDSPRKSVGLTLYFYSFTNDYASSMRIVWFGADNTILREGIYQGSGPVVQVFESVSGYSRIDIEFLSTNTRERFIKLVGLDYGIIREFQDNEIDTMTIVEETDPIGDSLSINTVTYRVKTHNPTWDSATGDLDDDTLMRNQRQRIIADDKPFGTFFLDTWKDTTNEGTVFDFVAVSAMGVLNNQTFPGRLYNNVRARDAIQELFDICFPTQIMTFQMDSLLVNSTITGFVSKCTCREALQQIVFAIGGSVRCMREGYVWIHRRDVIDIAYSSTPATNDRQPFVDILDLREAKEDIHIGNYSTCEHNQTILNGLQSYFPDNPYGMQWGWLSKSVSGPNKAYSLPPMLRVAFDANHTSTDVTLYFYPGAHASEVRATWYNSHGVIIQSGNYTFDSDTGIISKRVQNYQVFTLEVLSSNVRERYVKLWAIDFGLGARITLRNIYQGGEATRTAYYSGVDVVSYEYVASMEEKTEFEGMLGSGWHTISFSSPLHSVVVSGAKSYEPSNGGHVRIYNDEAKKVVVTGKEYIENQQTHNARDAAILSGEVESIVIFDGCRLVSPVRGEEIVNDLADYFNQRRKSDVSVRLNGLTSGNIVRLDTRKRPIIGTVERLEINMRGNRAKMRLVGNVDKTYN